VKCSEVFLTVFVVTGPYHRDDDELLDTELYQGLHVGNVRLRSLGDGDANCLIAVLFRVASLQQFRPFFIFCQKLSKTRFPDTFHDVFVD